MKACNFVFVEILNPSFSGFPFRFIIAMQG